MFICRSYIVTKINTYFRKISQSLWNEFGLMKEEKGHSRRLVIISLQKSRRGKKRGSEGAGKK